MTDQQTTGSSPAASPWPLIPEGADPIVVDAASRRAVARFADALDQLVNELPSDATLDTLRDGARGIVQAARTSYTEAAPPTPDPTPAPSADDRAGFTVTPSGAKCDGCLSLAIDGAPVDPARITTSDPAVVEQWMTDHAPVCPFRHPELIPGGWPPA